MKRSGSLVFIFAAAWLLRPGPSWAGDYFADLYLGSAWTQDADVSAQLFFVAPPQEASRTATFEPSAVFGGRIGAWPEPLPWLGVALDVSAYRPQSEVADISVVPLSILLMLRWPLLREPGLPGGRLQPYLAVGPSIIYSNLKMDLRPSIDDDAKASSLDSGWDFRGGLAWQFHRHLALFGEYRYLHFRFDYEEKSLEWFWGLPRHTITRVDTDMNAQQLLAGLSYRF